MTQSLHYRSLWLAAGWLMLAFVVYGSLSPSPPETPGVPHGDKLLHLLAYLVLMGWFGQLYEAGRRARVAASLVVLGVVLELLQGMGGVRFASWADGLANAAGVAGGWALLNTRMAGGLARLDEGLRVVWGDD